MTDEEMLLKALQRVLDSSSQGAKPFIIDETKKCWLSIWL